MGPLQCYTLQEMGIYAVFNLVPPDSRTIRSCGLVSFLKNASPDYSPIIRPFYIRSLLTSEPKKHFLCMSGHVCRQLELILKFAGWRNLTAARKLIALLRAVIVFIHITHLCFLSYEGEIMRNVT
jgi:hypothetical protein